MGRVSKYTAQQKLDAVLAVLAKRKTVSQVCRELGVSETGFARWREQALAGMELGLSGKAAASARERELEARLADAEQMLGRVVAENELRGKALRRLS
jgi:transposase-like protein